MADKEHLEILAQGVEAWDSWRERNPSMKPDFSDACLTGVNLEKANLTDADLTEASLFGVDPTYADFEKADLSDVKLLRANLMQASLFGADLTIADLSEAKLFGANLMQAKLFGANLTDADLSEANLSGAALWGAALSGADLSGANLTDANLHQCALVKTNLTRTTLTGCSIYGISAWSLNLEGAKQHNLNVSDYEEPAVMVDNLEVAQFVYLLLHNERIRQVIDTITSKVVLILGRFTADRKAILDAIRDELRQHDYLPILFDFEKPAGRDLTETISTLAHMARFIIADITEAKSIPQELQAIVPNLPSVPVQPLLLASEYEYGMFEHFKRYPWVLEVYRYKDSHEVLTSLENKIISRVEAKARELSR
jgi:uncharacterized protein YjbI with pentapeptide repeats